MDSNNMNENYGQQSSVLQSQGVDLEEPVSMKEWIISLLLLMIPCVNIILMFVWAFSKSDKKSKSNFFKAYLIFAAIIMVLSIVVSLLFSAAIVSMVAASGY